MIHGHGGNRGAAALQLGCRPDEILDMSSNINPLGMPPGLFAHLQDKLGSIRYLPEVDAGRAVEGLADFLGIRPDGILMGNGTTQFIYSVILSLQPEKVLIVGPTYADYSSACQMFGVDFDYFLSDCANDFAVNCSALAETAAAYDLVFLCNPNNPTGHLIPHEQLLELCRKTAGTAFVIDESYLDFVPSGQERSMLSAELENVMVLWSVSKIFAVPGLRAGFLVSSPDLARQAATFMQPWCASSLAQEAVLYLTDHSRETDSFISETRRYLQKENALFRSRLKETILQIYPTSTSFSLIALPENMQSEQLCQHLLQERLLIRDCANFHGLSNKFVRVSLKGREENERLFLLLTAFPEPKK